MALTASSTEVTRYRAGFHWKPVAAAITIYLGSMVVEDGGYAKKSTGVAQGHLKVIGVCRGGALPGENVESSNDADNSAGLAGALRVKVEAGVLALRNDATIPLVQADAGLPCYAVDDEYVSSNSAEGNRALAGIFLGFEPLTNRCLVAVGMDESQAPRIWSGKANADLRLLVNTVVKLVNDADKAEAAACTVGTDIGVFGILLNAPNINEVARVCVFGPCPGKAVAGGYIAADVLMAGAGGCLIVVAAARYSIAIALETAGVSATKMVFVQRGTVLA